MSFENETQDFMRKFFDDTINSFKEESAPLIKQFIAPPRQKSWAYKEPTFHV
jgi:hypothetical protein